jgi:predicted protein tyrosine phosphatase
MKEIYTNLYIGDDNDCDACSADSGFSIVHACQSCHQRVLKDKGSLPQTDPSYLIYEQETDLYLNLIDSPYEFLPEYTHPVFKRALEFIQREIKTKKVLVHCNFGYSRSPSIGLIYLAMTGAIPRDSFVEAANEFGLLYPKYSPGTGIILYMQKHWNYLVN